MPRIGVWQKEKEGLIRFTCGKQEECGFKRMTMKSIGVKIILVVLMALILVFGFFCYIKVRGPDCKVSNIAELLQETPSPNGQFQFVWTVHNFNELALDESTTCISVCKMGESIDDAIGMIAKPNSVIADVMWRGNDTLVIRYTRKKGEFPKKIGDFHIVWERNS